MKSILKNSWGKVMAAGLLGCTIALAGCGQANTEAATTTEKPAETTAAETTADESAAPEAATYEVNYGESKLYTKEDIDAAIKTVMAEFDQWDGATMQKITYAGDDASAANLEYCNSLRAEGTDEFTEALVLTSDFHSPSAEKAEGTAWEPDTDYKDYSWSLARTNGGEWHLLTWGYA